MICVSIVQFCQRYGYNVKFRLYHDDRRVCACRAVQNYQGEFTRPVSVSRLVYDPVLSAARHEHVWLLRAEGYSLNAIGARLDVTRERVRQMIHRYGRKVTRAIRHASFTIQRGDAGQGLLQEGLKNNMGGQ
jgi:Sigma-70, region 4